MYQHTCNEVREATYGILAHSDLPSRRVANCASGFMIAPAIIATVSHALHVDGDRKQQNHQVIEIIRAPDVGQNMETATLIAEDTDRDLALLHIEKPRRRNWLTLVNYTVPKGTSCGFLGYPLSEANFLKGGLNFNLIERFQSAYISTTIKETMNNRELEWYETDNQMYSGSSGCPGFLLNGSVFGMQANTLTADKKSDDESKRLAIARQVPSTDIIAFARKHGVQV